MDNNFENTLKTGSYKTDSSKRILLGENKFIYVLEGRVDLFLTGIDETGNPSGRLFYIASAEKSEIFGFFNFPTGYMFIARSINDSEISEIEYDKISEKDNFIYLEKLRNWNNRLADFLPAGISRNISHEDSIDINELARIQGELTDKIHMAVNSLKVQESADIKDTRKIEDIYSKESDDLLNKFFGKSDKFDFSEVEKGENNILSACRIVAEFNKIKIPVINEEEINNSDDTLAFIAAKSGFRYRKFQLEDKWWNTDMGAFIGLDKDGNPLALIPSGRNKYTCFDISAGNKYTVNKNNYMNIEKNGFYIYKPFPKKKINYFDLLKFTFSSIKAKSVFFLVFFGILSGILSALIPVIVGYSIEYQIPSRQPDKLLQLVFLLASIGISSVLFSLVRSFISSKIEFQSDINTQIALWDRLVDLPPSFFRSFSSGEIGKKVLGFYQLRVILSNVISDTLLSSIFSVFYLIVLFLYSKHIASYALGIILINLLVTLTTGYFQLKTGYKKLVKSDKLSGFMLEMFMGVGKIRLSGAERRVSKIWTEHYVQQKKIDNSEANIRIFNRIFNTVISILSSMLIFYLASKSNDISTGSFVAFNSAFNSFQIILMSLSTTAVSLSYALSILKNVKPVLNEIPEIKDSKTEIEKVKGDIEFRHVNFKYESNSKMILKDLSLRIKDGEYVAIVGESGSGKSTLLRLILGFEKQQSGKIYIGGKDIETTNIAGIRKQMGVVLQNSRLLSGDVFTNIAGNNPEISVDDVWEACEKSGIKDDIKTMPMELYTYINENSSTISGGQKQRILIARALVNKPEIILFDEATSALDNITQSIVTGTLQKMTKTRVVIAHRLSTVINCDKIFVMKKGQIVETGDYDTLMKQKGYFYELVKRQLA